ncbi:MAG: hypothetical protein K0U93_30995 [Gammaproteobacteria bacterium]|nr:hypothetical protein [Gammaproteobacteria bacterium]
MYPTIRIFPNPQSLARLVLLGCCFALALSSGVTHADSLKPLLGKWHMAGEAPLTIEFKPDGSYVAVSPHGLLVGHWEVTDNKLATWRSPARPKRLNEFRFDGDSLIITDARGVAHVHNRVRE